MNSVTCIAHNLFPLVLAFLLLPDLLSSTSAETTSLSARSGGILQVLVPIKPEFQEFVECSNGSPVKGFCIDVFKSALDILIPKPNWTNVIYTCYLIGDNTYDTMIKELANKTPPYYDGVVGDVTISAARLKIANFTQSYLDSGIVIVAPAVGVSQHFPGVFFAPFTIQTWAVMIISIILTGLALWLLERNENPHLQRTQTRSEDLKKVFWFVTSIIVFFKRESIKNPLAKFVMIAWTLFILLLGSSYTASLSSILTVNVLNSETLTLDDLARKNLSVGYQSGSIVQDYLVRQNITNLLALDSMDEYANALHNGRVSVVVDEIPYISLFLAAQSASNCTYVVSPKLTIEGFGFAFHDKVLSSAFSVAILNLSESGQTQRLKDGWKLNNFQCPSQIQSTRLDLKSSEGLFLLLGAAIFVCVVIFVIKKLLPWCVRTYMHMRANGQRDAINNFWEPTFQRSVRRRFSARHNISYEEFV